MGDLVAREAALRLLGDFRAVVGGLVVALRPESERLLVFLALSGPTRRARAAGLLWPDASEAAAAASLRSALWRLGDARRLVVADRGAICLADDVAIDLYDAVRTAAAIVADIDSADASAARELAAELLPGWYDDWVIVEAERWRLLRIRALDELGGRLLERDRLDDAIAVALATLQSEPLHERAHAIVVEAHVRRGDVAEARRHYETYAALLRAELDIEPGERLQALVGSAPAR